MREWSTGSTCGECRFSYCDYNGFHICCIAGGASVPKKEKHPDCPAPHGLVAKGEDNGD